MNPVKKIELEKDEKLFAILRGFLWRNFFVFIFAMVCLVVDFFFMFFLFSRGVFGRVSFFFILFLGLVLLYRYWVIRIGNCLLITNRRLIDVSRTGLINEEITVLRLSGVEAVSVETRNLGQRIFGLADLVIAGANGPQIAVRSVRRATRWQNKLDSWCSTARMSGRTGEAWIYELSVPALKKLRDLIDRRIDRLGGSKSGM